MYLYDCHTITYILFCCCSANKQREQSIHSFGPKSKPKLEQCVSPKAETHHRTASQTRGTNAESAQCNGLNLAMESSKCMRVELKHDDMGPIWQNASWGHRPTANTSQEHLHTSRTLSWCVGTGSNSEHAFKNTVMLKWDHYEDDNMHVPSDAVEQRFR